MLNLSQNALAVLCLFAGMIMFCGAEAFTKFLTTDYQASDIMFIRSLFISAQIIILVSVRQHLDRIKTKILHMHILRSSFSAGSFLFGAKALAKLGLYSYKSIFFLGPIYTAIFGIVLLKEQITKWHIIAFIFCLSGIFIAFQPSSDVMSIYGVYAVIASLCSSLAVLVFKKMASTESTEAIIFYYSLCSIIISTLLVDFSHFKINIPDLAMFAGQSLLHVISSFLYTYGLRSQKLTTIAIVTYAALPSTILTSWLIFNDIPKIQMLIASVFIVMSNAALISQQLKQKKILNKKILM